jgi:uncharacterized protein (TIGR02145 family)
MKKIILMIVVYLTFVVTIQAQTFKSTKIGKQVWMSENLNVDKFRNGVPILESKNVQEWNDAMNNKIAAWCYYNYDSSNGPKHGKLYNDYAVHDSNGLAPKGWHIPTVTDWEDLGNFFGGYWKAGLELKSNEGWVEKGNGTNSSSFNALPSGKNQSGDFQDLGITGSWWSFNPKFTGKASFSGGSIGRRLSANFKSNELSQIYSDGGQFKGYSVRCIKD